MARDVIIYSTYSYISGARPLPDDVDALDKLYDRLIEEHHHQGNHATELDRIRDKRKWLTHEDN